MDFEQLFTEIAHPAVQFLTNDVHGNPEIIPTAVKGYIGTDTDRLSVIGWGQKTGRQHLQIGVVMPLSSERGVVRLAPSFHRQHHFLGALSRTLVGDEPVEVISVSEEAFTDAGRLGQIVDTVLDLADFDGLVRRGTSHSAITFATPTATDVLVLQYDRVSLHLPRIPHQHGPISHHVRPDGVVLYTDANTNQLFELDLTDFVRDTDLLPTMVYEADNTIVGLAKPIVGKEQVIISTTRGVEVVSWSDGYYRQSAKIDYGLESDVDVACLGPSADGRVAFVTRNTKGGKATFFLASREMLPPELSDLWSELELASRPVISREVIEAVL